MSVALGPAVRVDSMNPGVVDEEGDGLDSAGGFHGWVQQGGEWSYWVWSEGDHSCMFADKRALSPWLDWVARIAMPA